MRNALWIPLVALGLAMPALDAASAKSITMKTAHVMAVESARHKSLLEFEKYVEEKSGGAISVDIYPSGQLGQETELIESLKMGTIEGYVGGAFDHLTPKLNLFVMPFLFSDLETFTKVTQSPQVARIMSDAEKNGIKILSIGWGGSRNITNNVRPIKVPSDMKGLKMRTPPMEPIIRSMEALGANPVMIPYGDVYMALKTGVADGQENPNMNAATMKFHEVQKYLTVINYMWNPEPFVVNKAWLEGLDPSLQKIVQDAAWLYTETQNKLRADSDAYYLDMMRKSGIEVYTPSQEERALFREACASVYSYFIDKKQFTQEEFDEFRKLASGR